MSADPRTWTLAKLEEWERACQDATPGPWFVKPGPDANGIDGTRVYALESDGEEYDVALVHDMEPSDANFIALSRTVLLLLIASVRKALEGIAAAHMEDKAAYWLRCWCGRCWPCPVRLAEERRIAESLGWKSPAEPRGRPIIEPCPFCGKDSTYLGMEVSLEGHRLRCDACDAKGPPAWPGREAIRRWNRRPR